MTQTLERPAPAPVEEQRAPGSTQHLYQMLQRRAATWPDAVAVGGQQGLVWKTLTSRELLEVVNRLAAELAERGVEEGDRVVLWLPNHWRTPVYLFAVWKLGAVVVPFDHEMNPEAGARILASVGPRLVIVGYGERPAWAGERDLVDWWEPGSRGGHATTPDAWAPPAEDLAALVFTSGTTGVPKGCMITHANLLSQVEAAPAAIPLDANCRLASILPLSHLYELTCGLVYPLATGAAVHYVPSRRGPDIVRVLSEQRITHMMAVPQLARAMGQALDDQLQASLPRPLYRGLMSLADRLPFEARRRLFWPVHRKLGGSFRMLPCGGAALPAETQRLWERFGVRVVQGYGASECSPSIACSRWDGSTPIGSVGRAVPGVSVRLSPEGELLVRGPNVMRGYWNDPERTAEVLKDGWYATGDLGEIDAQGNIRLAGRAKELIVLPNGLKVWPGDVEDVLREDPDIGDAAVIQVPTATGGATLHAYLVPATVASQSADLASVLARANGRLAQHQRIATTSWWPERELPRTPMLKLRRHLLPLPEATRSVRVESVQAADDPVSQVIGGVAHVPAIQPTQTLRDLGLDSLALVDLSVALEEKTGKAVGDGDLRLEMSVDDVRKFLSGALALDEATGGGRGDSIPDPPLWPYTWGRVFRTLGFPIDLVYRYGVTRTTVLGGENLAGLPPRAIFAGTHHGFPDMPLVRHALVHAGQHRGPRTLVVANAADGFVTGGPRVAGYTLFPWYGVVALGLCPLRRDAGRDTSLRHLAKVAAAGNDVLIFPQGTHARPEQERADDPAVRFRAGVAHLARALDAVVVPFGLAGTEAIMPAFPTEFHGPTVAGVPLSIRRGPLVIAFGAPVGLGPDEGAQAFANRLQVACYALTRQAEVALPPAARGEPVGGKAGGRSHQEAGNGRVTAQTGATGRSS